MKIEDIILTVSVLAAVLSIFFIPKNKTLQAQFVFLFTQFPSWLLGLCAVEWGWLEYPHRELSTVNRTSFIFEYFVLPMICVYFMAYFPTKRPKWIKVGYYVGVSLALTGSEYILESNTMLIKYTGWNWWWSFLSLCFIFWLSRIATIWFFKKA